MSTPPAAPADPARQHAEGETRPGQRGPFRRLSGLLPAPLWVLLLVLLLTAVATATVRGLVRQQQTARFEREVTTYQRELRQRFQGYAGVLVAVRAAWEAVAAAQPDAAAPFAPPLSADQFTRLTTGLDLDARYPGLSMLGYAPLVTAQARSGFGQRLAQLSGRSGVKLHPDSTAAFSAPVIYLAPSGISSILGYDMYTDPVRRQAIDRAIGSGQISSTTQLALLSVALDDPDRNGLLLYLPVRQGGRVTGLLYAPLRISAVLPARAPVAGSSQIRLSIVLGGQNLRSSAGQTVMSGAPDSAPQAGFSQTETLVLAGQEWTLAFTAPPDFGSDAAANIPWLVFLIGTLVALLAGLATQAQVRARQRAERVSQSLRQSQSRLERARAEFEAVFQAIQDTAVFTDRSGQVLFANDASRAAFGLTPFELRGAPLSDLHADPLLISRLDAVPGPHLVTSLFRRRQVGATADENTALFYGEMQRSQVTGEGGEVLGHLEVIRDISERLQADRARRVSERRYQGVLEGMPQIVFLADAAGQVTYFNRRWWDYAGQPAAPAGPEAHDWSGDLLRAIHPDDRADFSAHWQEALSSGRDFETEHRLRGANGIYRTFVTRGRPVRDARGQVLEWVGSSTDIDDQIYAEANSRLLADVGQALSDRHLPGTGHASPAPAYPEQPTAAHADTGLNRALNLMALRFADSAALWTVEGRAPQALPLLAGRARRIGLGGPDMAGHPLITGLTETVSEVMFRQEPGIYHGRRLHALGLSSAVLMPLSQGDQPLGVLGLGFRQPLQDRDLELAHELGQRLTSALDNRTLLARLQAAGASLEELNGSLEQRVEERTAQLSEANSELEAFSYSVSHDLRAPLRHIMGFADLLGRELVKVEAQAAPVQPTPVQPTPLQTTPVQPAPTGSKAAGATAKATRYLGIITESAERMNRLIDDLLEFSRTSRAELRRSAVDLGPLIEAARHTLTHDLSGRQIDWQIGPMPTVVGDPALLRQVFDNLLSNALKYTRTREHARIEVTAHPQGREVWLSVRDNGVGFDPEYAGKLFGVFQRLHKSEEFEGTGIGLANVRRIVSRHGGRVWAESDGVQKAGAASGDVIPGGKVGATFWVALPLELLTLEKPGETPAGAVS